MLPIKLGMHFLTGGNATLGDLLNRVAMKTVKFTEMDLDWLQDQSKLNLLSAAKAKGCLVVGRRVDHNPNLDRPDGDMAIEAQSWIKGNNGWGGPSLLQMAIAFPQVDVWEGPNEIDINPSQPNGVERMKRYASFCYEFARVMSVSANRRVCVGSWSAGTPDISLWQYWGPALAAVVNFKGYLSRHEYGPLTGDEGTWYMLRHRRDQDEFSKAGFNDVPLLITECGADKLGTFPGTFRQVWGNGSDAIDRYWGEYLRPYAQELQKDPYVIGAHLFTCGTGNASAWNNFNVNDTDLAGAILRNPISNPVPVPPVPVPVPPSPKPDWATHQVTASVLNVREYPWCGVTTPPLVGQFQQGKYAKSYAQVKLPGMSYGWHLIGPDGNMWVNGLYLRPV